MIILGVLRVTSANNWVFFIRSPDPLSESDAVLHMLQKITKKSQLLEDETKKILSSLKVSYSIFSKPWLIAFMTGYL